MSATRLNRIRIAPLRAADAEELVGLLDEAYLRASLRADDVEQLRARFQRWELRRSADWDERWLNWIVRAHGDGRALGWVQATIVDGRAVVAYATLPTERRRGVALEALGVMITELRRLHGVTRFEAHIEPRNLSSQRVAAAAGFARTDRSVGGEAVWTMTA